MILKEMDLLFDSCKQARRRRRWPRVRGKVGCAMLRIGVPAAGRPGCGSRNIISPLEKRILM